MQARIQDDREARDGPNPAEHGENERKDLIAARHKVDAYATNLTNRDAPGTEQ